MDARRLGHRRGPALAGLLFVVLAGIVGMHGLDAHGASLETAASSVVPAADEAHAPVDHSDGEHGAMTALAMCVAVLAAALAGIAVCLRRHRGVGLVVRELPRQISTASAARRDRDPPSLDALCILRC